MHYQQLFCLAADCDFAPAGQLQHSLSRQVHISGGTCQQQSSPIRFRQPSFCFVAAFHRSCPEPLRQLLHSLGPDIVASLVELRSRVAEADNQQVYGRQTF